MKLNPVHVEWSRNHFRSLNYAGMWGIPRSGMVFHRLGDTTLALTARMPYQPGMPITAMEFDKCQRKEFEDIKQHFEAAGINVIWACE